MYKKGMTWQQLGFIVIAIVALVLIIIWQGGTLDSIKQTVAGFVKISFGQDELTSEKATVPNDQKVAIESLIKTIEKMRDSPRTNCFAYTNLPNLGENLAKINLNVRVKEGKNILEVITMGGAGAKQEASYTTIENVALCVIAGTSEISTNFVNFLETKELKSPYLQPVKTLSIYSKGGYNHLEVPELGEKIVNNQNENFESSGWLFKSAKGNICFMPTNYGGILGSNADEDGINNDYFTNPSKEESIPAQIAAGKLDLCSLPAGKDIFKYHSIELFASSENSNDSVNNPIYQTCEGIIGKDCTSKSGNCDSFFSQITADPSYGCWIMASEDNFLENGCAYAQAKEESIISPLTYTLISVGMGKSDSPSALRLLTEFSWSSNSEKELICSNDHNWYACSIEAIGKEISLQTEAGYYSYLCTKQDNQFKWALSPH